MCDTCNDTGIKAESREGTMYYYTCKDCEKYEPCEYYGYELRQIAENNNLDVPVTYCV